MPKTPEELYEQHRKDVERIEKAKKVYEKHLEEARKAADLIKHPELWDQASKEYQAETKKKITEALKSGNYTLAEELLHGLRQHQETIKKYKEIEEKRYKPETPVEKGIVSETKEKIFRIITEADWQRARDEVLDDLKKGYIDSYTLNFLAEMRKFDPKRFDKEVKIDKENWQKLIEVVQRVEDYPDLFLFAAHDLKAINPKLFKEQFQGQLEKKWEKIMREVRQEKDYFLPGFISLASAIKDIDPKKFQQEIGISEEFTKVIWPKIVKKVEQWRERYSSSSLSSVLLASEAQNIKPEGEPDITIDEKTWNKIKKDLDFELHGRLFRIFFIEANAVSCLKVEKK